MKIQKIIFILVMIFLLLGFSSCYAVELNMTDDTDLTTNITNTNSNSTNTIDTIDDDDETEDYNVNTNNGNVYNNNSIGNSSVSTDLPATVTNIDSTTSNDGLQLSDILNILLIAIGVLLILLSIAILIRLKK